VKIICGPKGFSYDDFKPNLSVQLYSIPDNKRLAYAGHGIAEEIRKRKISPSPRSWDFLSIALSVICADMAGHRKKSPDGWTREFDLTIAVIDPEFWKSQAESIQNTLNFLTTDRWCLNFTEGGYYPKPPKIGKRFDADCLTLFSGGMDSLIGTIDLVNVGRKPVTISQVVQGDQAKQKLFPQKIQCDIESLVMSHKAKVPNGETPASQRSRSIAFLAYAALVASSLKDNNSSDVKLVVSENGFISLNTPLTPMRVGSLSTRTTHPTYLSGIQEIFDSADIGLKIHTPYALKTKGEMLSECKNQALINELAHQSTSCGRFLLFKKTHCGRCVPCLVRRAAFHKWRKEDRTTYVYKNLGKKGPETSGFDDVRAVAMAIIQEKELGIRRWMGAGLASAPISNMQPYYDIAQRGLKELDDFLKTQGVT
jgi:7-cyano-7-deazaguanine synthase in queuosine biosynthesis